MICLLLATTLSGIAFTPPASAAATVNIVEGNQKDEKTWTFQPPEIVVKAGETIMWKNSGSQMHSATADDDSFDSGNIGPGKTWQRKFADPGEFTYHCTPHPFMTGKVRVT
jgi:plastocyanin